ncbi:MAG: hypothetical protein ACREF6_07270, partial [Alphaproteobacteria bacterium]
MARARARTALTAVLVLVLGTIDAAQGNDNVTGKPTVLEILFDAPHRMADSMMAMPAIDAVERPFAAALEGVTSGDLDAAHRHAAAAGYAIVEKEEGGR